jgi:hypothetical protein
MPVSIALNSALPWYAASTFVLPFFTVCFGRLLLKLSQLSATFQRYTNTGILVWVNTL